MCFQPTMNVRLGWRILAYGDAVGLSRSEPVKWPQFTPVHVRVQRK